MIIVMQRCEKTVEKCETASEYNARGKNKARKREQSDLVARTFGIPCNEYS